MTDERRPVITISKSHPIWTSIDDDDWGGGATANFLTYLCKDQHIDLEIPQDCTWSRFKMVFDAMERVAATVVARDIPKDFWLKGK